MFAIEKHKAAKYRTCQLNGNFNKIVYSFLEISTIISFGSLLITLAAIGTKNNQK